MVFEVDVDQGSLDDEEWPKDGIALLRHLSAFHSEIEHDDTIFIKAQYTFGVQDRIEVTTDITARKKGDTALTLLAEELQDIANRTGRRVVHIGVPTHEGAERLFQRNPHYEKDGENYIRLFDPMDK